MKKFISIVVTTVIMCSILMGAVFAESESTAKFNDVKESDWFAEAVGKMNAMKIIDGMPGGSFNPKGEVTRAQFVKMLVQAMGYKKIDSVSFNDIKPFTTSKPHWASVYIETALRNGVISKDEIGNNFYPDVPLTRKDMGMMMFRALKLNPSEGENPFADITEANGYLTKLYEEYLIRGSIEGGKRLYKPEGLTTRAEAAVIMARMMEYKENPVEYVKTVGLGTRIKEGIATEEDIKLNREVECKKQAEDKTYIVTPKLSVEKSPEKMYFEKFIYSYIHLGNYNDYADDVEVRTVCITDKTQNSSYGQNASMQWHETHRDIWKSLQTLKEGKLSVIGIVAKGNMRKVSNEYIGYDYNYKPGTVLVYEVQLKRGSAIKKYSVNVVIP